MSDSGCSQRLSTRKGNMKRKDDTTTVDQLRKEVSQFIRERDWEKFHNGKNLSMSIAIEAAELMEHFQWSDPQTPCDAAALQEIRHELADVVIYALDFCNLMDIDLASAIKDKMKQNRAKYPAKKVRGKSHKYTYYQNAPVPAKRGRVKAVRQKIQIRPA